MDKSRGLWRGKRKDNGDWVKGYYSDNQMGECWICFWDTDAKSKTFGKLITYQVDPETLGECTGLSDINGKFIFEGDVVNIYYLCEFLNRSYIKYEESCFWPERIYGGEIDLTETLFDYKCDCNIEIIGNIHDNPELLKGDGNDT